jgi:hypothetical protein
VEAPIPDEAVHGHAEAAEVAQQAGPRLLEVEVDHPLTSVARRFGMPPRVMGSSPGTPDSSFSLDALIAAVPPRRGSAGPPPRPSGPAARAPTRRGSECAGTISTAAAPSTPASRARATSHAPVPPDSESSVSSRSYGPLKPCASPSSAEPAGTTTNRSCSSTEASASRISSLSSTNRMRIAGSELTPPTPPRARREPSPPQESARTLAVPPRSVEVLQAGHASSPAAPRSPPTQASGERRPADRAQRTESAANRECSGRRARRTLRGPRGPAHGHWDLTCHRAATRGCSVRLPEVPWPAPRGTGRPPGRP